MRDFREESSSFKETRCDSGATSCLFVVEMRDFRARRGIVGVEMRDFREKSGIFGKKMRDFLATYFLGGHA